MSIIKSWNELLKIRLSLKDEGKKVVFTNGVFDLIHAGHVDYLTKAGALGDVMIVGMNSDSSVTRIKGDKRPILRQEERGFIISNLKAVDYLTYFDQDTPAELIKTLLPDVLVKGADWAVEKIVGADVVTANGGQVKTIEFVNNQSTSKIIKLITERYKS